MGDAINIALQKVNTKFSAAIWADQIYLNKMTILKTISFFTKNKSLLTFPVFVRKNPYTLVLRKKLKKFDNIGINEIEESAKILDKTMGVDNFRVFYLENTLDYLLRKK